MNKTETTLNRALELQVQKSSEKIFIHHKSDDYSYGHTYDLANRFAAYLEAVGIGAGDTVCLMLPRTPELIIAFLAATKIGALPAPINYLLSPGDVTDFIRRVAPKVLVSCARLISSKIDAGLSRAGNLVCIDTDNSKKDWVAWKDVVTGVTHEEGSVAKAEDVAYLNFTTGSSGQPKKAIATHANIYWNTRSAVESFAMDAEDIHLCMFASFAHPHELFVRALYTGGSIVLLEEINPKTIIRTINRYSVTCMMGLAPMYEAMAIHCGSKSITSLRVAESGGMFTRQRVNEKFLQHFGLPILSVWGSTETTGIALANTPTDYRTNGSMGKVCPHYQVKLVDENDRKVAQGEVGELFFKGPGVVAGYDDHAPFLDEKGWFPSGDMARVDEDGFYWFVERKSGMIKVVGLKVYPLQVELFLMEHPMIAEVAVLGVPDRRKGTVPKAFMVVKEGMSLDRDDILAFCKDRMPSYMVPKQLEVMASLPKVGSGKIDKLALVELLSI